MKYYCNICEIEFDKFQQKANHDRWTHTSEQFRIDSIRKLRDASEAAICRRTGNLKIFTVNCVNCHIDFEIQRYELKFDSTKKYFCSRSCANSRKFNEETNNKRKETFRKKLVEIEIRYNSNPKFCLECANEIPFSHRNRKFCSAECSNTSRSRKISENSRSNPNCGGETNYLKFKYNEIWMDSSWEVELAKFLDENNFRWIRSKKIWFSWVDVDMTTRRYHPDFYLPDYDVYLDPKNSYLVEKDRYKIEYVKNHSKINVIYGDLDSIKKFLFSLK